MIRYEIRGATRADEDGLLRLAKFLNSVNLPDSREHVRRLLEQSELGFSGQVADPARRKYTFVLEDLEQRRIVGTSTIIGRLGRRDAPYIYFDVMNEEKYSRALDKHFQHTLLRIGFSYAGPTEIGGLVVDPEYRATKEHLGLLISYVRFLFISIHRPWFQNELLAELLPPLERDGTSHLWEALGRHFTGMTYAEADLLSSENKDFVHDLFPSGGIYASLLDAKAQAVIGKVGPQTIGVEKMLRRIGFRYAERIDPFDGGPHFVADTDEVALVKGTRRACYAGPSAGGTLGLVAREFPSAPFFRAVTSELRVSDGNAFIGADAAAHLGASPGEDIMCLPLRSGRPREDPSY